MGEKPPEAVAQIVESGFAIPGVGEPVFGARTAANVKPGASAALPKQAIRLGIAETPLHRRVDQFGQRRVQSDQTGP
jgi:hypothetical protein